MSSEHFEILGFVSVEDWPFSVTTIDALEQSIDNANVLAPGNAEWVYSLHGDSGFYLVQYHESPAEVPG